jgi:hypothetical protein
MADGSLPDLQEQWQWDHCNCLVVISLLQLCDNKQRRLNYSKFDTPLHHIPTTNGSAMGISTSSTPHTTMTMVAMNQSTHTI